MTDCKKHGRFLTKERHKCFILVCDSSFHPKTSPTCSKCNFKKCDNGHCACDVSTETYFALKTLYETYCKVCLGEEYHYDFVCMPVLGKMGLTILEAKLDSAKVIIHTSKDINKIDSRIKDCLRIVRNAIEEDKKAIFPELLIKRCTFRETRRTRCNRVPCQAVEINNRIVWRCERHRGKKSIQPELSGIDTNTKKISEFV
jgi:hypothetical protein